MMDGCIYLNISELNLFISTVTYPITESAGRVTSGPEGLLMTVPGRSWER